MSTRPAPPPRAPKSGRIAGSTATAPPSPEPATPAHAHPVAPCRAHEILARIGDKWSVYVIHILADAGTLRFGELRRRVGSISQRMLTVTLRTLERDGLVTRRMYPEVPPRVEYALTPLGATLRGIVGELIVWSEAHLPAIDAARARYDAQSPSWGGTD